MTDDFDITGTARVHLREASAPPDAEGVAALAAIEAYADAVRAQAATAAGLHYGGWAVSVTRLIGLGIHATFEGRYDEAVRSAQMLLPRGTPVDWSVDALALGGFVVGGDSASFGPGSPTPLLVKNHWTGRQERVTEEAELRPAVIAAIRECAAWWRAHPGEAADGDAAAHADAIDAAAAAIEPEDAPIPAHWHHKVPTVGQFDGPRAIVALVTESHLRWDGAKRVIELAEEHDPRKWQLEAYAIEHYCHYEGLAREAFATGARDAAALLRR